MAGPGVPELPCETAKIYKLETECFRAPYTPETPSPYTSETRKAPGYPGALHDSRSKLFLDGLLATLGMFDHVHAGAEADALGGLDLDGRAVLRVTA